MSVTDLPQSNIHFERPTLRDRTSQIRLLQTLPGSDEEDLQCMLGVTTFESAPSYVAISYTWGQPEPKRPIKINGYTLLVNQNCYDALWQLRRHNSSLHLWIDSICIDQDNLDEKSSQVQMMGQIYKQAQYVAACIGTSLEVHAIGRIVLNMARSTPQEHEAACERLAQQAYWSRLWIVQELFNAESILVFCGKLAIPWAIIMTWFASSGDATKRTPLSRLVDHWTLLKKTSRLLTLETALYDYRDWRCADKRDHVYALLSVVEKDTVLPPIYPDYSKSVSHLATDVAVRCMFLASQEAFVRVGRLDFVLDIFDLSFAQRCEVNDQVARQLTAMESNHRLMQERELFLEAASEMREATLSHYGTSSRYTHVSSRSGKGESSAMLHSGATLRELENFVKSTEGRRLHGSTPISNRRDYTLS